MFPLLTFTVHRIVPGMAAVLALGFSLVACDTGVDGGTAPDVSVTTTSVDEVMITPGEEEEEVTTTSVGGGGSSGDGGTASDVSVTTTSVDEVTITPGEEEEEVTTTSVDGVTITKVLCDDNLPFLQNVLPSFDASTVYVNSEDLTCGLAEVPLDRSEPGLGTTDISFVIWAAEEVEVSSDDAGTNGNGDIEGPAPLAVLQGGPGGASSDLIQYYPRKPYPQVFIDQRGTGFGSESLNCPEAEAIIADVLEASTSEEAERIQIDAYKLCADRLSEGSVLAHTNTINHAADVIDVMTSLAYQGWCVYGASYGTSIALEILRANPENLNCAILDGVVPSDLDLDVAVAHSAQRALGKYHMACEASPYCSANVPGLEDTVERLIERFNDEPMEVSLSAVESGLGRSLDVVLDGDSFASLLFWAMYDRQLSELLIPMLPALLEDSSESDGRGRIFALFALGYVKGVAEQIAEGTYFAATCADELPFTSGPPDDPGFFGELVVGDGLSEACAPWDVPASPPSLTSPVVSELPVLLLSGGLDPIAPPEYAEQVAQHLSNATLIELAAHSHGLWPGNECILKIINEFLGQPANSPDISCVDEIDQGLWW